MDSKSYKKINTELPIESTPLTLDDLKDLIPKYITTKTELYDAEFKNISEVSNNYFLSKKKFQFTIYSLYKVHKEMFNKVWKWAGEKRKIEKNIGVNVIYIDIELKKLLDNLDYWLDQNTPVLDISAYLHHRLVYIHPFNNGNGRWARLIVNIFLKDQLNSYLKFPENKLLLTNEIRKNYINALQEADKLNYHHLIKFHKKYISESNI